MLIVSGLVAGFALAGCSRSSSAQAPAAGATVPTPAAAATTTTKVDINAIFPPGPGRDLVLNNCTTCHTFVPIVVLQMTKESWERSSRNHRDRVTALSDADFTTVYEYLSSHFNPDHPVPPLPKELLDTWTSY